ncbi:MAG: aldose 1-epimerase family protein [Clostridia bacterium]|nr:aldose 1-epimerase family protein [Clostridia bacterium]
MSLTTIRSDRLTVVISSLGAEIQSIRDEKGMEYMWYGDPAVWDSRAPILFPVAGGLKDDGYSWQGKWYPMPKHGIARKIEWETERAEENRAVFLTRRQTEGFPFAYELRAIFTVTGSRLEVCYAVTNRDRTPFCFSVGAHEAYLTPEGVEAYKVVFDESENLVHSTLDGALNDGNTVTIAENTRELPLKYDYFTIDALIFRSLKSRGVTLTGGKEGRRIRLDFPDHPFLLIWTKPNAHAPYVCLEPWCNGPDMVDAPAEIDKKPGFMRIEPGETVERRHWITVG